jgi:hypothetical protein
LSNDLFVHSFLHVFLLKESLLTDSQYNCLSSSLNNFRSV